MCESYAEEGREQADKRVKGKLAIPTLSILPVRLLDCNAAGCTLLIGGVNARMVACRLQSLGSIA